MSDIQAIADRVQIEALRGEATDAGAHADPPAAGIAAAPDRSRRAVMEEEVI